MKQTNSLQQAQNPETTAEILEDLSNSKNSDIRKAVASNPNTPTEILFKLGAEFPQELLENPVFDLLILERPNFLEEVPEDTLIALLKLEQVPDYCLEWAASQQERKIVLALTVNPKIPHSLLKKIVENEDKYVWEAAKLHVNWSGEIKEDTEEIINNAIKNKIPWDEKICTKIVSHPFTPTDILEKFAKHESRNVRYWLAYNQNTPAKTLEILAKDPDKDIRSSVANNNQTPANILRMLWDDPNDSNSLWASIKYVNTLIENNCNNSIDPVKILAEDEKVRCVLAAGVTSDSILEILAKDRSKKVRLEVAKNDSTPDYILQLLAKDKCFYVRTQIALRTNNPATKILVWNLSRLSRDNDLKLLLAENSNTPDSILEILAKDPSLYPVLAQNQGIPINLFKKLAKDGDRSVREKVASNPNTPDFILEILASDRDISVRKKVASNPNTPGFILAILATDEDYWVRSYVAENPNTSDFILEILVNDKDYLVRSYVAKNPNTPDFILEILVNDKDDWVRRNIAINPNIPINLLDRLVQSEGTKRLFIN